MGSEVLPLITVSKALYFMAPLILGEVSKKFLRRRHVK